jgi:hypothetical protein
LVRRGLAVLATAYLVALLTAYFFAAYNVRRHQVEAAAFIFVFLTLLALPWVAADQPETRPGLPRPRLLATLTLAALTMYLGALGVGLLSDDYVLRSWVREGRLLAMGSSFTRPVALALWRIVFLLGGGAVALHLVNLILHAVNTWLAARLSSRIGLGPAGVVIATLVFVLWPTQVEPVVWASGIFDVLSTTWMLLALLVCARESPLTARDAILVCALSLSALLTKESAVALPALALLVMPLPRRGTRDWRRTIAIAGALAATTLAYFAWRLMAGLPLAGTSRLSRYVIKEQLSRTFGTLAAPLAEPFIRDVPTLALAIAAGVIVLVIVAVVASRRLSAGHMAAIRGLLWCAIAPAPTIGFLFIGPLLEGSRYLYMPALGWGWIVAGAVEALPARRAVRWTAGAFLAVMFGAALLQQQRSLAGWRAAATERDRILDEAVRLDTARPCATIAAAGLPASLAGAQLFTNGFGEALFERRPAPAAGRDCRWTWTGSTFREE